MYINMQRGFRKRPANAAVFSGRQQLCNVSLEHIQVINLGIVPAGITNIYIIFIHCLGNIYSVCMSVWSLALIGFYCIKNQWRNVLFLLKTYTLKNYFKVVFGEVLRDTSFNALFSTADGATEPPVEIQQNALKLPLRLSMKMSHSSSSRGNTRRLEVFLGSLYIYIYSLYIQTVYTFSIKTFLRGSLEGL